MTKEEILEEVYLKQGSPSEFEQDNTAWKKVALSAMERYKNEHLKEFGEGIARMIQYNTGNTVAQIKEAIRRFQNAE